MESAQPLVAAIPPASTHLSAAASISKQLAALGLDNGVSSNHSSGKSVQNSVDVGGTDVLASLDSQLKLLRKEIKTKDEKIQRLTEHSMNMANHMDKLKAEVSSILKYIFSSAKIYSHIFHQTRLLV